MVLLSTPRLLLRAWGAADIAAFEDIYSRWEVARWLGPQPRRALAGQKEAREALDRWQANHIGLDAPYGLWALVRPEPGSRVSVEPGVRSESSSAALAAPIGTVLLLPLTDDKGLTGEVEVGWHLHPDHQGQGYATEAAGALLDAASEAGVMRVLALTDPDNTASQAVARRLGMVDEGLTNRWFTLTTRQFAWPS